MKINIFDFDGTIYNGDSSVDFYLFCLHKKISIIKYLPTFIIYAFLYILGIKSKTQMKEKFFKFLCSFNNINDIVLEFWEKHQRKIKDFYLNMNHDNDIIISASPTFLLKPICTKLKVKDLIASNVDKKTGKFTGENCHGEEKVKRLNQKYKNIIIEKSYSDSLSDKPILKKAKHPFLVKGNKISRYKEIKVTKYDKLINIIFNSAIYLLATFTISLILVSTFWLLKLSLPKITLPLSLILGFILISFIKKDSKITKITSITISLLVLIISILISAHVYDLSYDGNAYHKETILAIDRGWNPIYNDYSKFCNEHNLSSIHKIWATSYPKATWIIADSIYKITKNIETGKAINIIMIYISFGIFSYTFYKILSRKIFNLIIALLISINPIIINQIFSYYLDGFMGLVFYLTIISMALYIQNDKDKINKFILASTLIILVNCKFTGLAYAGIFCLSFYCYYFYQKIKIKEYQNIKKSLYYFTTIIILSVLLVGSNTYIKNLINYNNPLYPLIGKDKIDIITKLQPASFKNMSPIKKNYYSIFSRSANIGAFNHGEPELKKPFTYTEKELNNFDFDIRIGGYGVLFSGIFIISLIIILTYLIFNHQNKNKILIIIPIIVNILLLLFLSDGWWARYSPWLYLFVIIAMVLLASSKNKILSIFFIAFSLIVYNNTYLSFTKVIKHDIPISGYTREKLESLEGSTLNIYFTNKKLSGVRANLLDHKIKYTQITNKKEKKENMEPLYNGIMYYEKK